jgi:hypothetical protein
MHAVVFCRGAADSGGQALQAAPDSAEHAQAGCMHAVHNCLLRSRLLMLLLLLLLDEDRRAALSPAIRCRQGSRSSFMAVTPASG